MIDDISKLIQHAAWPLVGLIVILKFGRSINGILARIAEGAPIEFRAGKIGFKVGPKIETELRKIAKDLDIKDPLAEGMQSWALIDRAKLPMFLVDHRDRLVYFNDEYVNLLGIERSFWLNKPLDDVIDLVSGFMHGAKREKFLESQRRFKELSKKGLLPSGQTTEELDLRNSEGTHPAYRRRVRVKLHIDHLKSGLSEKRIGMLGVMFVDLLDDDGNEQEMCIGPVDK